MQAKIMAMLNQSITVKQAMVNACLNEIMTIAAVMEKTLNNGNKILIFGNGGSAADAQHLAAEFVNRFRLNRKPLAALALTTDTSVITSIANDFGYDQLFEKQVQALGQKGDIAWGLSTSGNSENVIKGLAAAKEQGLVTVGFTGPKGKMEPLCDYIIWSQIHDTPRVQEAHITIGHMLCELVEQNMFGA